MKSELDGLMQERNFDALLVFGAAENNPPMTYLTGGGHVGGATLVKLRGGRTVLVCNPMERDEAARSGLEVHLYDEYPIETPGSDSAQNAALRLRAILQQLGVTGRVGVYGQTDFGPLFAMLTHFQNLKPEVQLVGEAREHSLFLYAMETKDEAEVARIRRMGQITTEVVGLTRAYLTGCAVRDDEVLLNEHGVPLTIGEMKGKIRLWLAERNAEPREGFIFAIGRDAGVPHSTGNPADVLRLGQTIVFDIYPAEAGGGYFYDFTRTWSLGYATPEAERLYNQVLEVYHQVVGQLKVNVCFKEYQRLACELFERYGHKTPRTEKTPLEGYVHSLGHGVGLNIHERPASGLSAGDDNLLKPGVVVTIEPGLYYPERGMGFRIEDTYWVRLDGSFERLADYPYDFVLPMKRG